VRELVEWCFEFNLLPAAGGGAVPYAVAEELMVEVIVPWARAPEYTVGGGFSPAGEWRRPRAGEWGYNIGLAAVYLDQTIPEAHARGLLADIQAFAASHGARIEGGYREFTDEDGLLVRDEEDEGDVETDE
jgi:hypothetical protein